MSGCKTPSQQVLIQCLTLGRHLCSISFEVRTLVPPSTPPPLRPCPAAPLSGVDAVVCLQVITALSASCLFLLIRTCFGLLSVDHSQYSQQPRLLYSCMVLPELIALYIVALPGLISGVGVDLADTAGIVPIGTSNGQIPLGSGSPPWGFPSGGIHGQDRDHANMAGRGTATGDAVSPFRSQSYESMVDTNPGFAEHSHAHHGYVPHHDEAAQEDMQHASWQSVNLPGVSQVQPSQA